MLELCTLHFIALIFCVKFREYWHNKCEWEWKKSRMYRNLFAFFILIFFSAKRRAVTNFVFGPVSSRISYVLFLSSSLRKNIKLLFVFIFFFFFCVIPRKLIWKIIDYFHRNVIKRYRFVKNVDTKNSKTSTTFCGNSRRWRAIQRDFAERLCWKISRYIFLSARFVSVFVFKITFM